MTALHSAAAPASAAGEAAMPADQDPSATEATPEQIEQLIQQLEDPEQRAELIRQLEALQQARAAGEPADQVPLQSLDPTELVESVGNRLQQWWQQLLNVDVVWLLQHLTLSLVVLLAFGLAYRYSRRGMRRLEQRLMRHGTRGGAQRGIRLVERIILGTFLVVAIATLMQLWGFSLVQWVTEVTRLDWIRTAFTVVLIGTATMLLWSLADTLIAGTLAAQSNRLSNVRQRSRLRTVTPLIQGAARITISVFAVLLILGQLGVNIGPLLAGAGIIGLAVGFGAQSLIKDLLIGVTLLLEDAASVGDFIDINGKAGTVEDMGIRMMRLRDLEGAVHLIPYSEVGTVSNLTKDYGYALLDVGVAYKESVDQVIDTLVEVAAELRQDEDFGPLILEDLEVMGVNAFADSKVEVRVRIKTNPLERWRIAREYRRRIKARFDEVGIEIPFPHRTLFFGADKEGQARPLRLEPASDRADGAATD